MLRAASPLLGILVALAVMSACGGESSPASTTTAVPSASQDALTEMPDTPTPANPAQSPLQPSTMAATAPPTLSESPTAAPLQSPVRPNQATSDPEQDIADIRRIVEAYWAALNDYDVDHAITMLEPGYRGQEEELIRSDIGRMKLFRVKLEVSEDTAPSLNADGNYETYLSVKTPVDTRKVLMVFRRIDGQWWIVFSAEVE